MNPNTLNSSNRPAPNSTTSNPPVSRITGKPIDCSNPQDQQEMNYCAVQSYEKADRELQAMYQQMHDQMPEASQPQLEKAQQEWVEFRSAECRLEAKAHEGGSLYPTVLYRCMTRMTRDRMTQLQEQVQPQG
ncbi:lysozyme inhibitor LprI family protein [Leptolyngbya ohadii]|uniref:lysozyme inhibitor LprI family protein n=1 Tax=Leptolyngbya ohadii TaxID=1962290 RepID=UPI000B5A2167|nr:lysozyme inhibitor LprI family protein [Leptolyngbya ohadii]